jgi:hypothetical protein
MNSLEISNILSKNRFTKNYFQGVYSSNNINSYNNFPYGLVVNTDRAGEPGTHWVAIFVKNADNVEYFDSYGEPPNSNIENFLKNFKIINKNKTKIQSIFDISCGPHVIYYIIQKCRGKSMNDITNELDTPFSDSLVKLFVYELVNQ